MHVAVTAITDFIVLLDGVIFLRPKLSSMLALGARHAVPLQRRGIRAGPIEVGRLCRVKLGNMEVTLNIPDDIAKKLAAAGGDVSRRVLEAIALEGYREQTLTLYQVSEILGLTRVETEDFLGQHHVPLAAINEADLDREAALFKAAPRRNAF